MKILIINNSQLTLSNGTLNCEPRTGKLAKDLVDLGNDVDMYGQIVSNDEHNIHTFDIKNNNINVFGKRRLKNKILNYLNLYVHIIPHINNADFVYIFYPTSFKYITILCQALNTPYGLYIRGEKDLSSIFSKWSFSRASIIFTVADHFTNYIKNAISKNYVFTTKPLIFYTEKDINTDRVYSDPVHFNLLFLGRIEKDKGVFELLNAIYQLKERSYCFSLDIVGEGPDTSEVINLINELDIADIVELHGAIKDPQTVKFFYSKADIFVMPTYHEGFPRTLYEAMIFGTPIITTFVGGISSLMKHKYNCLEITPKSVRSIVETLDFSFNNYSILLQYTNNAFKTVYPIINSSRKSHANHLISFLENRNEKDNA